MKRYRIGKRPLDFGGEAREFPHHREMESHGRWAISYADFMTLLLAFFLVSYFALAGAKQAHPAPPPQPVKKEAPQTRSPQAADLGKKIREWVSAMKLSPMVSVQNASQGATIRFNEKLLFRSGQARLTPPARRTLDAFGKFLREAPFRIEVEGYTDNVPISSAEFPSNWHLGAARATTVLCYLVKHEHIPPDRISAASYGETHPLFPNDTPAHRAANRRVDIVLEGATF